MLREVRGQRSEVRTLAERLAGAQRKLIAAVKLSTLSSNLDTYPSTASEWLAESYYRQSQATYTNALPGALDAAKHATEISPNFGFAWVRVAELEFSFGQTARAKKALAKAIELSSRNGQALALKGFLLAAENKIGAALAMFDQAIAADSALGNAWLGRGLCRIRRGDREGGRADLHVAAALEPNGRCCGVTWAKPGAIRRRVDLARRSSTGPKSSIPKTPPHGFTRLS